MKEQIIRVQDELEGILNDFESGESDKDETVVLLRNYVYERAEFAVKHKLSEIRDLIDEMTPIVSSEDEEENYSRIDIAAKIAIKYALTELKEKL